MKLPKKCCFKKKGAVSDIIFIMIIIFVIAITMIISIKIFTETNNELQQMTLIPNQSKQLMSDWDDKVASLFNGMFLFLFMGVIIAGVVLASRVEVSPGFFVVGIIVFIIAIALAAIFANIYNEISQNDQLKEQADRFSIMNFIMENFPTFMLIPGTLILIVLYAKARAGGGQ